MPLPEPDLDRRGALLAMAAAATWAAAGCGQPAQAPDFDYTLLDGTRQASQGLRGRVVLMNFWATSCAVCVKGMPALVATHQKFSAQGLATLAVAMQYDAPARVSSFAVQRQLPFDVVIDNTGAIAGAFGPVQVTPTTLLIARGGHIVWRDVGEPDFDALRTRIARLLATSA